MCWLWYLNLILFNLYSKFLNKPSKAAVYNIGGGYENSISLIESIKRIENISNKKMIYSYSDESRIGDHICYYSNLNKLKQDYPDWDISKNLNDIFLDVYKEVKSNLNWWTLYY